MEGATTVSGMTEAVTSLMGIVSNVMAVITGNEVLFACFVAGLVFTAIGIVKALK